MNNLKMFFYSMQQQQNLNLKTTENTETRASAGSFLPGSFGLTCTDWVIFQDWDLSARVQLQINTWLKKKNTVTSTFVMNGDEEERKVCSF